MKSLNKVEIIGNVTADPEIRKTNNGTSVANFSVATNMQWKDSQGEDQESVEFHNIVAWSKLAEIVQKFLQKWSKVFIEWRLQTSSWEDDQGTKRYKTEIVMNELIMLWGNDQKNAPKNTQQNNNNDIPLEDVPF